MSPHEEYSRRLKEREAQASRCDALHGRVGSLRLLLAAVSIVAAWFSLQRHAFSPLWLLVPVAAFVGAVFYHHSVRLARMRAQRAVEFYKSRLARLEDRWAGTGSSGERFDAGHHVYAADLDLFGKGSLFELLSAARTRMGEETLSRWLLSPASVEAIRQRHASCGDLRDRLDLREDLAVLAEHSRVGVHPDALLEWAEDPNRLDERWIRVLAVVLPALAIATAVVWSVW
ncbi:MAG TPA: hypothetical protein VGO53_10995, partial [Steroidobacteraceae bacterium]|nr:hypothetical protein [Steroidobacteraceae bacterium]